MPTKSKSAPLTLDELRRDAKERRKLMIPTIKKVSEESAVMLSLQTTFMHTLVEKTLPATEILAGLICVGKLRGTDSVEDQDMTLAAVLSGCTNADVPPPHLALYLPDSHEYIFFAQSPQTKN